MRDRRPGVPWSAIAGLRDKIVHYCFGLDDRTVIATARISLPRDTPAQRSLLRELDTDS